ncbi:MAG: CopG family antitoxin [Arenicellales bacterium]
MNKSNLPPVLNRQDFDTHEEYKYYLASESGDFVSVSEKNGDENITDKWQKSARVTINGKRERITIAVPERNLSRIKSLALRRGIPYQTLINETLNELAKQSASPL